MERQRTKIGARILSEQELNMILPNADSVFEQIEVFRRNIADTAGQQTNNIGIIGCRGAGKTSILKTFSKKLEERRQQRYYAAAYRSGEYVFGHDFDGCGAWHAEIHSG